MNNREFKITYIPLEEIQPANYNPRAISDDGLEGLVNSIKEFGLEAQPLVINTTTKNLVSGHQRLKAAQKLELEKVPVIFISVPLKKEKALNVTLNNKGIQGFFTDNLQSLLDEIVEEIGQELYEDLRLDSLEEDLSWDSDIEAIDKVPENLDGIVATIKVTCPQEIKDEVLIYLKAKLMETSFEGVHIE